MMIGMKHTKAPRLTTLLVLPKLHPPPITHKSSILFVTQPPYVSLTSQKVQPLSSSLYLPLKLPRALPFKKHNATSTCKIGVY